MRWLRDVSLGSLLRRGRGLGEEPLSARSLASRFVLIIVIFAVMQAIILAFCLLTIEGINATRAYVAGEDTYTKAQKRAARDLRSYVARGEPVDLEDFRRVMAVLIGDRDGREALEARPPDLDKAFEGFVQGGNDPRDIKSQSWLFILFSSWQPFDRAIADWRTTDRWVGELAGLADDIVAARAAGPLPFDDARRIALVRRINELDDRFTRLEDEFSAHMGDAARAARSLAMLGLVVGSVLLWMVGISLAWRSFRIAILAEGRLARSEHRFRDFAKVASDWFWETDAHNRLTYLSGRAAPGGMGNPAAFIGKTLIELAKGDPADESWRRQLEDVAARRPFRDFSYSHQRADGGEQFWSLSGSPVYDPFGKFAGFRGTGSEVTRDVLAQRSLQHAKEQAETANRAKSEFLANMSHELRTPLNAILGFAEIIRERLLGPVGDRYAEYANDIHSSGTHLLGIINDILDLSKVEAGRLDLVEEIVDIQSIVRSVILLLRERVATAELALKVELPDALLLMRADDRKLKQVLMNLLSNAVKFTPAGGTILVRVRVESARGIVIEVRDSGIGIAPEDIGRALSPFGQVDSRLSRRYEGTGLGLPLARALVVLHGGSLELESAPGEGTTVRVILPPDRLVEREMRRWIAG